MNETKLVISTIYGKKFVPPTINNVPVIQKLAYIHNTRIAKSPTIKSPGV